MAYQICTKQGYGYIMKEQGQRLQHCCNLEYKAHTFSHVSMLSIHDPSVLKASCAFSINIGSAHQPNQIAGLAHLMEHMLFINSQGYPQPHEFSKFISQSAGYENAQTCDFFTNYYFEVTCSKLEQALMRACDAFAHPLFDQSSIAAEMHAINEQYILCSNDDESRVEQLNKLFMVAPLNRFSMGSYKSLAVDSIRQHLLQFYKQYYRHPNATINVVIYSSLTSEEVEANLLRHVQKMSKDMFGEESAQQNNDTLLRYMTQVQTFPEHRLQKCIIFKSVSNQDCMKIEIIIDLLKNPQVDEQMRSKNYPNNKSNFQELSEFVHQFTCLIDSILCHPSKHNLAEYLQGLELTTDVEIQSSQIVPYTQFMIIISIDLDDHALDRKQLSENMSRIYTKFIEYLELHLIWDNVENIANEMCTIAQLQSANFQIDDLEDHACQTARNIQEFGLLSALSYKAMGNAVILQRRELTQWCLQQLVSTKNHLILISTGDDLKGNVKYEPYLNTNFLLMHFPSLKSSAMQAEHSMSSMLPPNPFLSSLKQAKGYPITNMITDPITISESNGRIHFSHSGSPIIKGGIKMLMHTNESFVFCRLFAEFMDLFIEEFVQNYTYAQSLGLNCYFDYQNGQLFAYFYGFTPLIQVIVEELGKQLGKLIKNVKNGEAKSDEKLEDIFDEALDNLQGDIDNYYEQEMDYLTDKIRDQVLIQNSLPLHMISKEADKIKKNKFLQRCADLLTQCVLEWIVVGNFNLPEITHLIKQFELCLGNLSSIQSEKKVKQTKVMNLSNLSKPLKLQIRLQSEQIKTSTCLTYFEAGPYSQRLFWMMQIAEMYLEQPFYQHCRINKKLTYDLQVNVVNTRGILGICFLMVSSKIDSEAIANQIRQFLQIFVNPDKLQQHLTANLGRLKQSLILKHSQPFSTVEDSFDFICDQVSNRSFYFASRSKEEVQSKLANLSLEQIVEQLTQIFSHSCLEILLVSKCHKDAYGKHKSKTISLDQIKSNADYYKDSLADLKFSFRTQH